MTKTRLITTVLIVFGLYNYIVAQIPAEYYDDAAGLSGTALKTALHTIIDDHSSISYSAVENALKVLDEDPNNSNNVILLYKQTSISKSSFGGGVNNWNREHIWPSSHGDFGDSAPEGSDLFHMKPTDASVNSARGEKDFDNCQATGTQHDEATQCYYTSDAWEPPDNVKGDIARSVFYMEVRYEGGSGEADLEIQDFYTGISSSPGYLGVLSTLIEWHNSDPVDAAEQARNNTIYSNYQGNRNPFIDHPEYVGLIWGPGFATEPINHVSGFDAHTITLGWTDAVGGVLPDAYLIRMSDTGFDNIDVPVDGVSLVNNFWNKNVDFGVNKCVFSGLSSNTTYYFKIYGYTGSGITIDYKTNGSVQQVSMEAK